MPAKPNPFRLTLALLLLGSPLHAAEPQATFAFDGVFLQIGVEQDGVIVKDAKIRVLDLGGATLADGELEKGIAIFPLDRRSGYLIGITIPGKKKESDFVTLRRQGNTLTPPRVSLSFSKPCCRVALPPPDLKPTPEADAPRPAKPSPAWIVFGVSGACMLVAGMMLMFFRRP